MQSSIKLPKELASELERLARAEHRSLTAYAIDILWHEVKRCKQLEARLLSSGLWNVDDHPELDQGGAIHIERTRRQNRKLR